ncbi:lysoplasmalogenase [Chitinophaga caseinilytica]|uniref:Lysoplasmalogenase n=1 Tax=Chitinophaga caseinilytica TaxID=2267521 RepID=A0ABZ2Z7G8_9BACT
MKPAYWITVYFLALLADIGMIVFDVPQARFITKPLLMILLGVYGWVLAGKLQYSSRNFIFAAVIFSWSGDVFLLFPQYFLPGLVSFLTAHLMYIGFFGWSKPRPKMGIVEKMAMVAVLGYAVIVLSMLYPKAGEMKIPVVFYTIVITSMLILAVRAFGFGAPWYGVRCILGAFFFVVSDTVLAFQLFYADFPFSGVVVMATYGVAQWLIVSGSLYYLRNRI